MPPGLRRAHQAQDRTVDRPYRRKRFTSERERVEYVFALYERMHRSRWLRQLRNREQGVGGGVT